MEQIKNENRLSFNLLARKKCDAIGMILHCENLKARNKSTNIVYPENTKLNVNSPNIFQKYNELTKRIEDIKGKKIQKNANHYLEGVLAFPEHLVNQMGINVFREKAPELIEKYMEEIKEVYGFEPCGYSLHFDEGHKADKNGNVKDGLNIHAHLSFINYDFKENKARFRDIQKKYVSKRKVPNMAFVAMQDLAGQVFAPLGFKRGISKQITGLEHKSKEEFINNKLDNLEKEVLELKGKKDELEHSNNILLLENYKLKDKIDSQKYINDSLRVENGALRAENIKLKDKMRVWFKNGLEYVKTSIKGIDATKQAERTIDSEPSLTKVNKDDFYNLLSSISNNDIIKKIRKKRNNKNKP